MSKVVANGFDSRVHGWHFPNSFGDRVAIPNFPDIPPVGHCGGMSFLALDYWYAGMRIPSYTANCFGKDRNGRTSSTPVDGTDLRYYILRRLIESMTANAWKWISWSIKRDHSTWFWGEGVPQLTRKDEFPKLFSRLAQGKPQAIGLIREQHPHNLGSSHVVVAYGAEKDDVTGALRVFTYDPNHPDRETVYSMNAGDRFVLNEYSNTKYRGFFVEDYTPQAPLYFDLALVAPPKINPYSYVYLGGKAEPQFTLRNCGEFPAPLNGLYVSVTGPDGNNLDVSLGLDANNTPLARGAERNYGKISPEFGDKLGVYRFRAGYQTHLGNFASNIPVIDPSERPYLELLRAGMGRPPRYFTNQDITAIVDSFASSILRTPPFVEAVDVDYGEPGEPTPKAKYSARWDYISSTARWTLHKTVDEPIQAGAKTLFFRIRFTWGRDMDASLVKLTLTGQIPNGGGSVNAVVPLTKTGDGSFTGSYAPPASWGGAALTLVIEGADLEPHFSKRQHPGHVLDSNPATTAAADTTTYPYEFKNYEPGADRYHTLSFSARATNLETDRYEVNNTVAQAFFVGKNDAIVENATLHNSADVDFFRFEFTPSANDLACTLTEPVKETVSDLLGISAISYPPAAWVSLRHMDDGEMDVALYDTNGAEILSQKKATYALYYNPQNLPGHSLCAKFSNSNYARYGALRYEAALGYTSSHAEMFVDTSAPAYRPQTAAIRIRLQKLMEKIDLPRPADNVLAHMPDIGLGTLSESVVPDMGVFLKEIAALYRETAFASQMEAALGKEYAKTMVSEYLALGKAAASFGLTKPAELYLTEGIQRAEKIGEKALALSAQRQLKDLLVSPHKRIVKG